MLLIVCDANLFSDQAFIRARRKFKIQLLEAVFKKGFVLQLNSSLRLKNFPLDAWNSFHLLKHFHYFKHSKDFLLERG